LPPLVVPRCDGGHASPPTDRHRRGDAAPLPLALEPYYRMSVSLTSQKQEIKMGRGLLLWLIGIPIPIILLIWLFGGLS
jgi:hypothetical protein